MSIQTLTARKINVLKLINFLLYVDNSEYALNGDFSVPKYTLLLDIYNI